MSEPTIIYAWSDEYWNHRLILKDKVLRFQIQQSGKKQWRDNECCGLVAYKFFELVNQLKEVKP